MNNNQKDIIIIIILCLIIFIFGGILLFKITSSTNTSSDIFHNIHADNPANMNAKLNVTNNTLTSSNNNINAGTNDISNKNNTKSEITNNNSPSNNNLTTSNLPSSNNTNSLHNKTYGLGHTITVDGLELTFDSTYSFDKIDNMFSEENGKTVIKLGVNVKNVSTKNNSLNMFTYKLFGSQGIELDMVSAYFNNDSIDFAGDLKPGASYKSYFYILYDGNGKYSIDFDIYSNQKTVEFNVIK